MRRFTSLYTLCLALGLITLTGCPGSGLNIKIWHLDESQGGLVRKQENEVLPFKDAKGYLCTSPSDFEAILQSCSDGMSREDAHKYLGDALP